MKWFSVNTVKFYWINPFKRINEIGWKHYFTFIFHLCFLFPSYVCTHAHKWSERSQIKNAVTVKSWTIQLCTTCRFVFIANKYGFKLNRNNQNENGRRKLKKNDYFKQSQDVIHLRFSVGRGFLCNCINVVIITCDHTVIGANIFKDT